VIFGLTISSAWGNGHATLWRGLCRALGSRGHDVVFFERDVPYYAAHRDSVSPEGCCLRLYDAWDDVRGEAEAALADADVGMVTSYCPDSRDACHLLLGTRAMSVFYDLDTGVTLAALRNGDRVPYLPSEGLADFDLVLSYTGGRALDELRTQLGARHVAPLYGSVDPEVHRPSPAAADLPRGHLSYLGTYAADRQDRLEALFIEPARRRPEGRFIIGGSQYPPDFPWTRNIFYVSHMPPSRHPAFYSSSALTLNITRAAMADFGHCPSGRLFEAAACGTPVLSDTWEGLDHFFEPGREILVARNTDDVLAALDLSSAELAQIARAARERTLSEHTADARARDFEGLIDAAQYSESTIENPESRI
jgi:spore maturation protein CgeB